MPRASSETPQTYAMLMGTPAEADRTVARQGPPIKAGVASPDPQRRVAAAYAIAALGDPDGVALLLELVEDDDEDVRAAAVAALKRMGTGDE